MADEVVDVNAVDTVGFNPRFPNTNQTKHCWANYVEFHKCLRNVNEDKKEAICSKFQRAYTSLCPDAWVRMQFNLRLLMIHHRLRNGINLLNKEHSLDKRPGYLN
jgi:cytochrome c oxidase subunit 6b